jgi:xylulokinase
MSFATTRGQIVRALLEGVMFEMAVNRDALAAAGVRVTCAVAVGGGVRSDRWLSIAADILDMPIRRASQREAACWGAARLAGGGIGLLESGITSVDSVEKATFQPDAERSGYYRERLAIYRELHGALHPLHIAL